MREPQPRLVITTPVTANVVTHQAPRSRNEPAVSGKVLDARVPRITLPIAWIGSTLWTAASQPGQAARREVERREHQDEHDQHLAGHWGDARARGLGTAGDFGIPGLHDLSGARARLATVSSAEESRHLKSELRRLPRPCKGDAKCAPTRSKSATHRGSPPAPAALFVKTAARFVSIVTVQNVTTGASPADAKSILAVMGNGAARGHIVRITADGPDEEEAITALDHLFASGLGEDLEA